jgi:hypothetical protein
MIVGKTISNNDPDYIRVLAKVDEAILEICALIGHTDTSSLLERRVVTMQITDEPSHVNNLGEIVFNYDNVLSNLKYEVAEETMHYVDHFFHPSKTIDLATLNGKELVPSEHSLVALNGKELVGRLYAVLKHGKCLDKIDVKAEWHNMGEHYYAFRNNANLVVAHAAAYLRALEADKNPAQSLRQFVGCLRQFVDKYTVFPDFSPETTYIPDRFMSDLYDIKRGFVTGPLTERPITEMDDWFRWYKKARERHVDHVRHESYNLADQLYERYGARSWEILAKLFHTQTSSRVLTAREMLGSK